MQLDVRETWEAALSSEAVRDRWASKVVLVPGSECLWWVGAISGRGHGRFWVGPDHVVIAHRFAFAMARGVDALGDARLLGHRCDNPLCQRIGDDHVAVSTARKNRLEWLHRRDLVDGGMRPDAARALSQAVYLADEETRRVGMALHDVGQALAGISGLLPGDPSLAEFRPRRH